MDFTLDAKARQRFQGLAAVTIPAQHSMPHVIRLITSGAELVPAFQFNETGKLSSVVVAVNKILDESFADEPLRYNWWLLDNPWLDGAPPMRFVGKPGAGRLVAIAKNLRP